MRNLLTCQKITREKTKENRIGLVFRNNNINYYSADSIILNGCSKYRPDYIVSNPLFEIIIEVDENQHKSYPCECENTRMINIHQDFGGKPVLFIRYNPDNYHDHLKRLVKPDISREQKLIDVVKKYIALTEWSSKLSAVYLFYDGYNGQLVLTEIDYFKNETTDNIDLV